MHARCLSFLLSLLMPAALFADTDTVEVLPTPEQGIQPRALVDGKGVLHLLWYAGSAKGGNLFHATRQADKTWSTPVKVNSIPDSAVAAGTIRGAQYAVGRGGCLHVIWNGYHETAGKADPMPLYYTRSTDGGLTFEPQRIISGDWPMDGGGAVAADAAGKVYAFWHAGRHGEGEGARRIFVRMSEDDGKTFGEERAISPEGLGVCGCCAMQALAVRSGPVHVLYRCAANGGKDRDICTLVSGDGGKTFNHAVVDPWEINGCPMSSMSLVDLGNGKVAGAWERDGQIIIARFDIASSTPGKFTTAMSSASQRKHPVLAAGRNGSLLIAWAENTGWNKGGTLAWQVLNRDLEIFPTSVLGTGGEVPVWSFGTVASAADGFVIVR
jgi:hypothetical protein